MLVNNKFETVDGSSVCFSFLGDFASFRKTEFPHKTPIKSGRGLGVIPTRPRLNPESTHVR